MLEDCFSYVFVILNSIMKVILYAILPKEVFLMHFHQKKLKTALVIGRVFMADL